MFLSDLGATDTNQMPSNNHSSTTPGPPKPLRLFVFAHPRTVSTLFGKLFSEHPSIEYHQYPFAFGYVFGPDAQAILKGEIHESLKGMKDMLKHRTYQYSLDEVETYIFDAEAKVCLGYGYGKQLTFHPPNFAGQDPDVQRPLLSHDAGNGHKRST